MSLSGYISNLERIGVTLPKDSVKVSNTIIQIHVLTMNTPQSLLIVHVRIVTSFIFATENV